MTDPAARLRAIYEATQKRHPSSLEAKVEVKPAPLPHLPEYFGLYANTLQKDETFDWLTSIGTWGDVICGLGKAYHILKHHPRPCGIIHLGVHLPIQDFLRAQGFEKVIQICPHNRGHYDNMVQRICSSPWQASSWLPEVLQGTGIDPARVAFSHINFYKDESEIHHWGPIKIPQGAIHRVNDLYARSATLLVQPRSENSEPWARHWPHWKEAVNWLKAQNEEMALCGRDYDPECFGKVLYPSYNLVGHTETMMEVFALAERCRRVVTTVNALAHYCALQGIPAVMCANRAIHQSDNFYRRFLRVPHIRLIDMEDGLEVFQAAVKEIL